MTTLTVQSALLALTDYWAEHGCVITQPSNVEVGAGTLNGSTFLRVLGPEPWRVAYVEPSVRPDDARYGLNPNRLQCHTQFQVILKPEPGNAQELYLGSLERLGIDTRRHDIRFVEDNWASPALGAWGLGWEVWLDGLEITQFTYFQQAGGHNLDPISVELTYGMERILMALQGVTHFKDMEFAPGVSYGEILGQGEYEWSRYYLDDADVESTRQLLQIHDKEAERLVELGLPVPAHAQLLKCSHLFNILDARGAVSTTERADTFKTMRGLARRIATSWMDKRAEQDHPLMNSFARITGEQTAADTQNTEPAPPETVGRPRRLLFEIGVEEMPPSEVTTAAADVERMIGEGLAASHLEHGSITVSAAPRRIVVDVADIADREPDRTVTVKGPKVSAAFDAEGNPTRAVEGFARKQGVDIAALDRITEKGNEHVAAQRTEVGRSVTEVLVPLLASTVSNLRSAKNMSWNAEGLSFARPIRWLVALLDSAVLPVTVANLNAGRSTQLHRASRPSVLEIPHADGYLDLLVEHGVLADITTRRTTICAQAQEQAAAVGGQVDLTAEAALVEEVTNLVEQPTVVRGDFDPNYLELPEEILTTVMRKHQRYFPVRDGEGVLLPHFLTAANGPVDVDLVRSGNQDVLRARYEDAAFFYRADLETPLEQLHAELEHLNFAERLGSMLDRARRIEALAERLGDLAGITDEQRRTLRRAAGLAKFDLGSQMVTEMTSLAGTMARIYAAAAGEDAEVAQALFEMELPRGFADELPQSAPGALLSLADRLDLLAGLFAADAAPTGSSDPYGMRRAAIGAVSVLGSHTDLQGVDLGEALRAAFALQPIEADSKTYGTALDFLVQRLERSLTDSGHPVELVRAVLPLAAHPSVARERVEELDKLSGDADFLGLASTMQRVRNIVPQGTAAVTRVSTPEPADTLLADTIRDTDLSGQDRTLAALSNAVQPLVEAVSTFFDEVLVNAEDPTTRSERMGLLVSIDQLVTAHISLDWAALPKDLRAA